LFIEAKISKRKEMNFLNCLNGIAFLEEYALKIVRNNEYCRSVVISASVKTRRKKYSKHKKIIVKQI